MQPLLRWYITLRYRRYITNRYKRYIYPAIITGSAFNSDSYAKNAASTNPAALEHINSKKGFTGIVMMDYAGTDTYDVGGSSFGVSGKSLTEALILNNF